MEELNLEHLRHIVLWATFAIGLWFGAVSHRSHFCTMGAVADIVNFGNWNRMRAWGLAIGVASLALQAMTLTGLARPEDTIYLNPQWSWLSGILGGLLFGVGMVLASGCGSKTLIRLGGGNLKALVVFLVLGLTSYMALKGILGVVRVQWFDPLKIDLGNASSIPGLLGESVQTSVATAVTIGLPVVLIATSLFARSAWNKETLLGGLGVGLAIAAVWWVAFNLAYLPEHPETLEAAYLGSYANRPEAFSFVAPYAYTLEWLMFYSDASRVLTVGVVACAGVVLGAAASAWQEGSFRWEGFQGVEDTANHVVGAALMGFGGILALGCTVGQGLSGASTLSVASWITTLAIVAGAWVALKYQTWRIERML
ncbi:YeeE/YedE family protein [Limnobacter humi]|uniref:YeeE/YedE family protein n=1 Tax=Limnobacter humi TaxID=1778671 RepID=A0ABT1WK49_9BURK|nr:YeeE/YedE family protein [Limnobacter humi]MCQ8896844.1 YeeE/YedE family protein [Limnobacter humi]